jgi:hypothetical protein
MPCHAGGSDSPNATTFFFFFLPLFFGKCLFFVSGLHLLHILLFISVQKTQQCKMVVLEGLFRISSFPKRWAKHSKVYDEQHA